MLVGFDKYISYPKIMKAASYARQKGNIFLATNEDSHLPMDVPYVIPGLLVIFLVIMITDFFGFLIYFC